MGGENRSGELLEPFWGESTMSDPEITAWILLSLIVGYVFGFRHGVSFERRDWTEKCIDVLHPDRTAHYCDGRFYVILNESYFVRMYQYRGCPSQISST